MEEWLDEIRFKRMPVDYVRVGVSFPEQGQEREVEKLDMICGYTDFDIASPEFCATYWFIKAAEPEEEIDAAALVIPARVKLELWQTTPAEITNVLKLVGHFVERSKTNALSETSNKMTIEIQNVRIIDSYGFAVEMGGLRAFKDLWAMGVHVNLFPDLQLGKSDKNTKFVLETAREMLEVTTKTLVDTYQLHGTKMLNVTTKNSPHYFQAIMSAAQVSSSLSMIDIEIVDEDEADDWDSEDEEEVEHNLFAMIYWKWIAYTLFSRHANHSIKTLMLDMKSLRQPHVSQMREIIAAANPLAELNYVAKRDCLERQLTATRFLLTDPGNMARKTQAVYVAPQPMTVRVIYSPEDDEYPYWTVLVPGHGNAWVHQDKATDVTELATPTDDWRNAVPSFERIDISASHEDCMDAAVSLLELIGHGTKEIIV